MKGNISLSTQFVTPSLGQIGYINNITSFTSKTVANNTSVILSQITLTPGVWLIFYKFKYDNSISYNNIDSYIYGLTTTNTLVTSANYEGGLPNEFKYSSELPSRISRGPVTNKESLAVSINQDTTYYLQFGYKQEPVVPPEGYNLNPVATSLYAVRIA